MAPFQVIYALILYNLFIYIAQLSLIAYDSKMKSSFFRCMSRSWVMPWSKCLILRNVPQAWTTLWWSSRCMTCFKSCRSKTLLFLSQSKQLGILYQWSKKAKQVGNFVIDFAAALSCVQLIVCNTYHLHFKITISHCTLKHHHLWLGQKDLMSTATSFCITWSLTCLFKQYFLDNLPTSRL